MCCVIVLPIENEAEVTTCPSHLCEVPQCGVQSGVVVVVVVGEGEGGVSLWGIFVRKLQEVLTLYSSLFCKSCKHLKVVVLKGVELEREDCKISTMATKQCDWRVHSV